MSYFVVVAGLPRQIQVSTGRLLELDEAQYYIRSLKSWFEETDGAALYWDDCDTGTSTELLVEVEDAVRAGTRLEDTSLGWMVESCGKSGATLRIWWAGEEGAHMQVLETGSVVETLSLVQSQLAEGDDISFVMKVKNADAEKTT